MNTGPRVVLGMPSYRRPDALPRTLESLLSQRFRDFALVILEDGRSELSQEVARRVASYQRDDPRVSYEQNDRRVGMVENWRRVFARARQRYPRAPYFAWVSDHDVWHARWLEEMVAVLDREPDVVLAYSQNLRMHADGVKVDDKVFETAGMSDPAARLRKSGRFLLAGNLIYGLMRADALAAAGVFRRVIAPDRQVLLAMSLFGQVRQVPEVLWYREFVQTFSAERQRRAFFPDGAPPYVHLPWYVQHAATLFWDLAVRGRARPGIGRLAGARYAGIQFRETFMRVLTAPRSDWREAMARHPLGRRLLPLLPRAADTGSVDGAAA
jgi:glycosyltransferase involved in cell wall biosynthesis